MRMKRGTHFVILGEVWSFVFEEERAISRNGLVFTDVCISEWQGTWCTYDAVADEARKEVRYNNAAQVPFFFHCVSHHLLRSLSTVAVPHTNALQYVDVILILLDSFIKHDRSWTHILRIYIQTLGHYQTAIVKITCLAMLSNYRSCSLDAS